ncbi:hypothetical protein ADIWIN_1020 [Winogradskyella psychrotolerans RS-3]|uniref:DUF5017 domain-containing protein n=1 Tax=Winogradskyella psychrotolerans RS-3 TaxID=641526 RepID=S7VUT8_9FLAO|nr:hypothetical protein [Winogradskyella psychrotolerans]EPR74060.1 hypothetical protein ADIWIN_1020 [Winogradskyella psychrotolerans RS-3]
MKKIIFLLAIVGTVFVGCNPLDDINDQVDAQENAPRGHAEYTLIADDYDTLELTYGSFSSEEDAKTMLPDFLADLYPNWGQGSSVLVGYDLYIGNAFDIRDYNLDQDDYTFSGSDGLGFNSDDSPFDYLADILATAVEDPSVGDYRRAKYFQYTGDFIVVTPTVSVDENFDYGTTAGDLTAFGSANWEAHSGAGSGPVGYATSSLSMADYPSSDIGGSITIDADGSEDISSYFTEISSGNVYASALVNLSTVGEGTYSFHLRDAEFGFRARVGAKDDGSGNILFGIGASSSTLSYGTTAFDLNTTYLLVSSYNIETGVSNLHVLSTVETVEPTTPEATNTGDSGTVISGVSVRQGFGGPTATIDGVRVANTWSAIMSNDVLEDEVVGDKSAFEAYFEYTGTEWASPSDNFYVITDEDFQSMGVESFGSSVSPEDYLSTFLGLKFPYAQEDDMLNVGYNYNSSSSGSGARGNLYTFVDGSWVAYQSTIATTLQFGFENGIWVPDNTIRYSLTNADYTYIHDAFIGDPEYAGIVATLTGYYNYDYNWSEDQVTTTLLYFLDHLDPTAEEGQKYAITYVMYDNGTNELTETFIKEGGVWIEN